MRYDMLTQRNSRTEWGTMMKKLLRALCGAAAALGWFSLQFLIALYVYSPTRLALYEAALAVVQILCWAALLHCVKAGIWRGLGVPVFCGIFTLIDLWWIVNGLQRVLWYYYGFPQPRRDDIMGILGILFCFTGMCVNITAAVLVIRSRKKPNMA